MFFFLSRLYHKQSNSIAYLLSEEIPWSVCACLLSRNPPHCIDKTNQPTDDGSPNQNNVSIAPGPAPSPWGLSGGRMSLATCRPNFSPKCRVVPAFTIEVWQRNTIPIPAPCAGAFKPRRTKPTTFRMYYERGDFPLILEPVVRGFKIIWKVSFNVYDFHQSTIAMQLHFFVLYILRNFRCAINSR